MHDVARIIAPVVTTTCVILGSNKIQNGNILVPANPGPPRKTVAKTERVMIPHFNAAKTSLSQCRTVVPHCCKGDAASQWEMAILGCQNSVTPEPID